MYTTNLHALLLRYRNSSAAFRNIDLKKLSRSGMDIQSRLFGDRQPTKEELEALPLETLEAAVAAALKAVPDWATPKEPTPAASAAERLESANAELLRRDEVQAEQRRRAAQAAPADSKLSPQERRRRIAQYSPSIRLSMASDPEFMKKMLGE